MNFSNLAPSTILLTVLTICILQQRATGQWISTQKYSVPFSERGCRDIQLNNTAQVLVADDKIYLFTDLADFSGNRSDSELGILVGEIDRRTALSLNAYEIEWWTSPNFTYNFPFLSGGRHESRIIFTGEQRAKYNVPNMTASLITFDPASHGLETIEWPSGVPEELLGRGAVVTVPEQKTTYLVTVADVEMSPTEVYIYNYSNNSMVRKKSPYMFWTTASFVQLGEKGILVMLGGRHRADSSPLPMDQVYVYVIATDKWYLQHTSGPAPSSRVWGCTVVTAAEDKSSHQIHLYGGHRPEDTDISPIVDNYYILSVPQFVWTRAPAIPKPRTMSFCNLLGSHRMLIASGFLESNLECAELLQILDLNSGKLTGTFGDTNNYTVPSSVISSIGGGALGGTNFTKPIGGFADGLEQDILTPVSNHNPPNSTTIPLHPPKMPLGEIIGGTVGGVAFAVLILCGFLFCRKRREFSADRVDHDTQAQVTNPGAPAYNYAEINTVIHREMGGGQDWIQSPASSVSGLPNSIYQYPSPVHELPGKM